ncbi:MAG: DJ-1/PfpI family protein [Treponema sp.]|nr:DJ-1/PfpI family protein [Treponema sp.]
MKTIAVFFANGFEMIEALTTVDLLRRAKQNVITVCVSSDSRGSTTVTSSHNVTINADIDFESYIKKYGKNLPDCVVCPGGTVGSHNLQTKKLLDHLEDCNKANKIVAAICASPAVVLGNTNILKNKKWTCYPGMQDEAFSEYQKNYADERTVIQENVITASGEGVSEEFSLTLVEMLVNKDEADRIKRTTLQR